MQFSSHTTRWLITFIAAPILIWVILKAPPWVFIILVAGVGLILWWEFSVAVLESPGQGLLATALTGWLLVVLGAAWLGPPGQAIGLALALIGGAFYFLFNYGSINPWLNKAARLGWGHLYISLLFSFLVPLFFMDRGRLWVLFVLLVTFIGDTAAFYVGRSLGRRPLYPKVSPKKTWEGLAGNLGGCALTAGLFAGFFLPVLWYEAVLFGLFLGLWGTGGDLFESMLKREAGLKDSGRILLGHGGIWDRIDAVLFNLPVIYLFASLRSGV